jgi:hypothetical protein
MESIDSSLVKTSGSGGDSGHVGTKAVDSPHVGTKAVDSPHVGTKVVDYPHVDSSLECIRLDVNSIMTAAMEYDLVAELSSVSSSSRDMADGSRELVVAPLPAAATTGAGAVVDTAVEVREKSGHEKSGVDSGDLKDHMLVLAQAFRGHAEQTTMVFLNHTAMLDKLVNHVVTTQKDPIKEKLVEHVLAINKQFLNAAQDNSSVLVSCYCCSFLYG